MIWFKFYSAWGDGVQELSDAEAGRFIKALCACAESKEIPTLSGAEKVLYAMASQQLKRDTEHTAKVSASRADAGRSGGLASKQMQANASKTSNCLQNEAKQANANNCSIKNKELRIKKVEEDLKEKDKEKSEISQKRGELEQFGEFVRLSKKEYLNLCTEYGKEKADQMISKMNDYIGEDETGKLARKYQTRNHNLTLRNWIRMDEERKQQKQTVQIKQPTQNKTAWEMLKEKGLV